MSSTPKYSDTEIESKRLLALRRKELAQRVSAPPESSNGPSPTNRSHSKSLQGFNNDENNRPTNPLVVQRQSQSNRYNPLKPKETKNFFGAQSSIQAKFVMITDNRFSVDISAFHQQVVDLFKTIPSRSYDLKTRIWNFHINDYDLLMRQLSLFKPRVVVEGLPNKILQIFKKDISTDYRSIDLSNIDPKLVETILPFQREGICYGISKNGRCIIADDMGLGKTIQALGIAHYYRSDWPLLIVTPSSVRYQWATAIYEFLPSLPTQYVHHFANSNDSIGDANIVIMSYDILTRAIAAIEKHIFGVIIFDESHFVKSAKSGRSIAAARIAAQARRVILLSGTPALSRPMELYSQINLIMPKFLGVHEFGVRYCAGTLGNFGWEYTGSSNMQELQLLLKRCCLIRRIKSEVLTQLPSKIREVVILDPKLIKSETKEMKELSDSVHSETLKGKKRRSAGIKYYQETGLAKLKAIRNYVVDLLESGTKFIIFAHHTRVMDEICEVINSKKIGLTENLPKSSVKTTDGLLPHLRVGLTAASLEQNLMLVVSGSLEMLPPSMYLTNYIPKRMNDGCQLVDIKYIRIDGSTKSEDRKTQCDSFQERDDYLVAVLSITAANTGITLTAAQRVIFAELYWNPGTICQAEDRVHRIGQKSSVLIQFLIAENTADDGLWPLIEAKLNVLSKAGLGQNFSLDQTLVIKRQARKTQTSMYAYIAETSSETNCEKNLAEEDNMELSRLLEIDDEDFSSLDLDIVA